MSERGAKGGKSIRDLQTLLDAGRDVRVIEIDHYLENWITLEQIEIIKQHIISGGKLPRWVLKWMVMSLETEIMSQGRRWV